MCLAWAGAWAGGGRAAAAYSIPLSANGVGGGAADGAPALRFFCAFRLAVPLCTQTPLRCSPNTCAIMEERMGVRMVNLYERPLLACACAGADKQTRRWNGFNAVPGIAHCCCGRKVAWWRFVFLRKLAAY